jgi:ribosomal protein S27E
MWSYVLQAENGLIEKEEADVYIKEGTILNLPDEEWNERTESYDIHCDECHFEYTVKTIPGGIVSCPVCGQEERIPE